MLLLRLVLGIEIALILVIGALVLLNPDGLQTVGLALYGSAAGTLAVLFGLWQSVHHAERRRLALTVTATPLVGLPLPFVLKAAIGGPVAPGPLAVAAIVAAMLVAGALLARRCLRVPPGGLARPGLNGAIAIGLALLLLMLWAPLALLPAGAQNLEYPFLARVDPAHGRAVFLYYAVVALVAATAALGTLVYAPIGFVRNPPARLVHAAQLLLGVGLFGTVGLVVFVLALLLTNPG